ncbi:MAG: hypothetical protein GEV06_14930 [Luteitalea sp.]|nr:hypothetical protein [Luteitalea sp.]
MVLSARIVVSLLLLLLTAASARPQEPVASDLLDRPVNVDAPLPDTEWLREQVHARLKTDEELLRQYTYRERRRDIKVSKLGKVSLGPLREFEVYPSPISGETYKRLVAVDGKPLDPAVVAQQDQEHRDDLIERREKLEQETPDERAERLEKRAKERQEEQERLEDGFRVFDVQLIGRDILDGRQMIVAELTPKPDADPKTRIGKTMKEMHGRAWVNEQDFEIAQVAIEVIDDVKIGWGIVGRLHAGSELTFQRKKVNDEIWLPSLMHVKMSGRTLLFRKFGFHTTTEYSDYRKFSVETDVRVATPRGHDDHP